MQTQCITTIGMRKCHNIICILSNTTPCFAFYVWLLDIIIFYDTEGNTMEYNATERAPQAIDQTKKCTLSLRPRSIKGNPKLWV